MLGRKLVVKLGTEGGAAVVAGDADGREPLKLEMTATETSGPEASAREYLPDQC